MLVILEGSDGVGKSTLAEVLRSTARDSDPDTETILLRRGPLRRDPFDEYERALDEYRPDGRLHVICDRWHVGELIYGPLLRGESRLDEYMNIHVEKYLRSRGALLVHVVAPTQVIKERILGRGDDLITPDHVQHLVTRYVEVIDRSWLPRRIVSGIGNVTRQAREILSTARDLQLEVAGLAAHPRYVGQSRPSTLLVGDVRADMTYEAAFVPKRSTSGHYLLRSLPRTMRYNVGITNAMDDDVASLWPLLGRPPIVTLGRNAHEALALPHGAAPHPQYVRRFHHAHSREYGETIRAASRHQENLLTWRP